MELKGKRYLVIGGETGLGRALAVGLAEAGADVAIASLTNERKADFAINSALNELWAIGRRGLALAINATDPEQIADAVTRAESELGRLDGAVVVSPGEQAGAGEEPETEETGDAYRVSQTLEALHDTLPDRPALTFTDGAPVDEALRRIAEAE